MQYIGGKSVQGLIDRGQAPDVREILRIGSQAAGALAAAHAQGLIHRDIKPANLLLEDGVERVKITDFGLARAIDDASMTQSGVVAGTPQYMSPEQARGEMIDHRTDLFSLGSVLYALCTGMAPFRGRSSISTIKRVCEETPTPISRLNPDIPSWLSRIIEKLHAKEPSDRYRSAAEVSDLLGRCLAHVQQPASVPLPLELCDPPRRRSVAVLGLGTACLLLVALLGFSGVRATAQQAVDYMATVLRLRTPEGTLVVQTEEPDVSIRIDDNDLIINGAGVKELRLSVGAHAVKASKDGKLLHDELVTITRGGRKVLTIRHEPDGTPAVAERASRALPYRSESAETRPDASGDQRIKEAPEQKTPVPPVEPLKVSVPLMKGPFDAPTTPVVQFRDDGAEVRSVAFSPDGRFIANGAKNGRIVLRSRELGEYVGGTKLDPWVAAHPGGVECVAFAPDGKTLASGGWDHHVKLWKLSAERLETKPAWDFAGYSDGVRSVAFSPGGDLLAAGGFDRVLTILEARSGLRVWTSPTLEQPINGVAFSPDGGLIALALGDYSKGVPGNPVGQPGEVHLWAWPGRKNVKRFGGWTRECKSVAFSPDGKLLAATSGDGTTRLYNVPRRREEAVLKSGAFTAGVAFHPGNHCLATSNWAGQVIFWDPASHQRLASFRAHEQNIPSIAFSTDGRSLATGSADGLLKVWDLPVTETARSTGGLQAAVEEADRLARVLRRHPPRAGGTDGERLQVYLRDLDDGITTLIADEPFPGLIRTSCPKWSRDGRHILFHASPEHNDWSRSQLIMLESGNERPSFRSLGTGNCPDISPDGRQISFLIWDGAGGGIQLMNADGSDRHRISERIGAPYWSPRGDQLLINGFTEPTDCRLLDVASGKDEPVRVHGYTMISWPSWVGPEKILAVIRRGGDEAELGILDVRNPSHARVEQILWRRGSQLNVLPRWPIFRGATEGYLFVGVDWRMQRNLYTLSGIEGSKPKALLRAARNDQLEGLSLSPGGRYLLINANWPDRRSR
jgi:WD40 repeat protein